MPTRDDFIVQIEADIKAGTEPKDVLQERLKRVKATKSDGAAEKEYFGHLAEVRESPTEAT